MYKTAIHPFENTGSSLQTLDVELFIRYKRKTNSLKETTTEARS